MAEESAVAAEAAAEAEALAEAESFFSAMGQLTSPVPDDTALSPWVSAPVSTFVGASAPSSAFSGARATSIRQRQEPTLRATQEADAAASVTAEERPTARPDSLGMGCLLDDSDFDTGLWSETF